MPSPAPSHKRPKGHYGCLRVARRCAVAMTLLLALLAGCSSGGSKAARRNARAAPPSTIARAALTGMITGRFYAAGGPDGVNLDPHPIIGTITVTNTETHVVYHANENGGGYFRVAVPVGSYQVVARAPTIAGSMSKNLAVTSATVVNADLGILRP
jgi:hypothetical protein